MILQAEMKSYLEYCQFRRELDEKTLKAYRIDLRQFQEACGDELPTRKEIEDYITRLHKQFKQPGNIIFDLFACW